MPSEETSDFELTHYPLDIDRIPDGWCVTSVGEITKEVRPGFASGEHNSDGQGTLHLRPMNIGPDGALTLLDARYVQASNPLRVALGDVLFNNTNSPALVGKTAHIDLDVPLAFSNHMTRLRLEDEIEGRFIAKQLHFLSSNGYFQQQCKKHVNQASISRGFLSTKVPVVLPPFDEQRRIVAKIEALQERSRRTREALAEVGPLLEQFRQSVLAAAFRGDLTADWREAHPDVEPASELLERIRHERRRLWEEAELAKYETKGRKPPKDWQSRYVKPECVDDSELSELPKGWCWALLGELVTNYDSKRIPVKDADRRNRQGGYPYYGAFGVIDMFDGYIFDGSYLLVAEDGKNLLSRNKPIAYQAHGRFWVNNHAHVLQTNGGIALSYLEAYLNNFDLSQFVTGIDQVKLNRESMDRIPVALAPAEEQRVLLPQIVRSLKVADCIGKSRCESVWELSRLDQSILTKAFRGELVPQDPNDEPASVLLERIRAERAASSGNGSRSRQRNRS